MKKDEGNRCVRLSGSRGYTGLSRLDSCSQEQRTSSLGKRGILF